MTPGSNPHRQAFWIFCSVVDNLGDAGVCWRLARQLAADHAIDPTLIIDQPATLSLIEPRLRSPIQSLDGVTIVALDSFSSWLQGNSAVPDPAGIRAPLSTRTGPDSELRSPAVIISAFGSALPAMLRTELAGGPARPLWIHLEYLSAEDWVESCHGLISVKPDDGAREHFLYPGFTKRTAGLLRETGLIRAREDFVRSNGPAQFLSRMGSAPVAGQLAVSLFCYPSAPVGAWLEALSESRQETVVYAAAGSADQALLARYGRLPALGERFQDGSLSLLRLPMLSQADYDRLLWSCSVNFVRGEDSWIRAHWAGVPFVWQAYPQTEDTHLAKLDAFLQKIRESAADPDCLLATENMMRRWNGAAQSSCLAQDWAAMVDQLPRSRLAFDRWSSRLAGQPDLAGFLAQYCFDRL